jgi:hypothetical protein
MEETTGQQESTRKGKRLLAISAIAKWVVCTVSGSESSVRILSTVYSKELLFTPHILSSNVALRFLKYVSSAAESKCLLCCEFRTPQWGFAGRGERVKY